MRSFVRVSKNVWASFSIASRVCFKYCMRLNCSSKCNICVTKNSCSLLRKDICLPLVANHIVIAFFILNKIWIALLVGLRIKINVSQNISEVNIFLGVEGFQKSHLYRRLEKNLRKESKWN